MIPQIEGFTFDSRCHSKVMADFSCKILSQSGYDAKFFIHKDDFLVYRRKKNKPEEKGE